MKYQPYVISKCKIGEEGHGIRSGGRPILLNIHPHFLADQQAFETLRLDFGISESSEGVFESINLTSAHLKRDQMLLKIDLALELCGRFLISCESRSG
jgi:hypothetical protein